MVNRSQSLADQVYQEILSWIQSNRLHESGGALPSETELSEMFSTSRATIREALAELERERLVIRRHGAGTFVSPAFNKLIQTFNDLNDPLNLLQRGRATASIGMLEYSHGVANQSQADDLEINAGDDIVSLQILYLLEDAPVAMLHATIPAISKYANGLPLPSFSGLMVFVKEISGKSISHSLTTLKATGADEDTAGMLQISPHHPLLSLHELYLSDQGNPIFTSTLQILTEKIDLQILRNSDQSSNQVVIW